MAKIKRGRKPDYIIGRDFRVYEDLSREKKEELHTKFTVMRHGVKRYDAIMTLAVYQKIKPEAISKILREDYNNFI